MKKSINIFICICLSMLFGGCGIAETMTLVSVSNTFLKYTKSPSDTNYASTNNADYFSQTDNFRYDGRYYGFQSRLSEYGSLELSEVGDLN